jgi:hypothetical protein
MFTACAVNPYISTLSVLMVGVALEVVVLTLGVIRLFVSVSVLVAVMYAPAGCFPLKVFQSVLVRYPLTDVDAAAMLMAGVFPPEETTGATPVTFVTATCANALIWANALLADAAAVSA